MLVHQRSSLMELQAKPTPGQAACPIVDLGT